MPEQPMTRDEQMRDYTARAKQLEVAIFDTIAAQGAAPPYLTPAGLRGLIEGVLADMLGRFFTTDIDEDVDQTGRARALGLIEVLRKHVSTHQPPPAPTRH
jgi:hypothetical protein